MLTKVLQTLASGTVTSHAVLARQLDVSEDMLTYMLGDLVRKEYVALLSDAAGDHSCDDSRGCGDAPDGSICGGCKSCFGCPSGTITTPKGWMLTAKGRRLATSEQ